MKILIVDNSAMNKNKDKLFTNSLNGLFVTDLIRCNNKLTYFQFAIEMTDSISAFDLKANGVECYPLKYYRSRLVRYFIAYLKIIPHILANDYVYFYYPTTFKYAAFLSKLFNKKYGLYIRGMQGLDDKASHWIYRNADSVFTVSDYFTNFVNNSTQKKIANTIRPMIPFTDKDVITKREYKRNKKYSILFLGRIARDKGIEELLKAVKVLKDKKYSFELKIVGNGEFLQEAKQVILDLGISDVAYFRGTAFDSEEVKGYYVNADLYILPTYHEGFPRTLYEAMIFGTPIITTFVGGISNLMEDGYNCRKIEPKSPNSIVQGLEFAMNNYDVMVRYAKNGARTVMKVIDSKRLTHAQHLNQMIKGHE